MQLPAGDCLDFDTFRNCYCGGWGQDPLIDETRARLQCLLDKRGNRSCSNAFGDVDSLPVKCHSRAIEYPARGKWVLVTLDSVAQMANDYTAAWNSKSAAAVASFFAENGEIVINRGDPWSGRSRVEEMAAGFYADVPDLTLTCNDIRLSGTHAIYVWTFTGHDANTGNPLTIPGWEEWELGDDLKVVSSRGWFDADDYARQVEGG